MPIGKFVALELDVSKAARHQNRCHFKSVRAYGHLIVIKSGPAGQVYNEASKLPGPGYLDVRILQWNC
jgi:hypothetical protein